MHSSAGSKVRQAKWHLFSKTSLHPKNTLMDLPRGIFLSWFQIQASWHPRLSNTSVEEQHMQAYHLYRHVFIPIPVDVIKYSGKSSLKERRVFVLFVGVQGNQGGGDWNGWSQWIHSQEAETRESLWCLPSPFSTVQDSLVQRMVPLTSEMCLPPQNNSIKTIPSRRVQRSSSQICF